MWWDKALASARLRLTRTLGADLRRLSAGYVDSSDPLSGSWISPTHLFDISGQRVCVHQCVRNQRNAAKMVLCTRFFQPIEKHSNLSPGTREFVNRVMRRVYKPRALIAFMRFYLFIIAAYSFHSPGLCLGFRSNERNRCNAIPWTVSPSRWTVMRRCSFRSCHVDCVGRSNPRKFVPRISGITLPLPRIFSYRRPTWWRMSFASLFVRLSVRSPRWSIPVVFSALWDPNRSEGIGRAIQYWSMPVLCCSQSAYRQGVDDTIAGRIAWDLAVSVTSSGRSALRESISQFSKPWRTEEQLLSLEIRRAQFDWHRWPWMPLFMATVVSLRHEARTRSRIDKRASWYRFLVRPSTYMCAAAIGSSNSEWSYVIKVTPRRRWKGCPDWDN